MTLNQHMSADSSVTKLSLLTHLLGAKKTGDWLNCADIFLRKLLLKLRYHYNF